MDTREIGEWRERAILALCWAHPCTIRQWIEFGIAGNYRIASTYSERLEREGKLKQVGEIKRKRGAPLKVFCNGWKPEPENLSYEVWLTELFTYTRLFIVGQVVRGFTPFREVMAMGFGKMGEQRVVLLVVRGGTMDQLVSDAFDILWKGGPSRSLWSGWSFVVVAVFADCRVTMQWLDPDIEKRPFYVHETDGLCGLGWMDLTRDGFKSGTYWCESCFPVCAIKSGHFVWSSSEEVIEQKKGVVSEFAMDVYRMWSNELRKKEWKKLAEVWQNEKQIVGAEK